MKPNARETAILKAFAVSGSMSVSDMERLTGLEHCAHDCDKLRGHGLLNRVPCAGTLYSISYKGRNAIGKTKAPMGEVALVRAPIEYAPLVVRPVMVRPGSQDFLACKSRRGDSLIEHRHPISLAGAM